MKTFFIAAVTALLPVLCSAQPSQLKGIAPLSTEPPSTKLVQPLAAAEFRQLAERCAPDAPLATLRSIVTVESAFQPYALSLNYSSALGRSLGRGTGAVVLSRQPANLAEALRWSRWFLANGLSVSIGLMQVNSEHLTEARVSLEKAFDPCWNLRLGWVVFNRKYQEASAVLGRGQAAMHAALSSYNTGETAAGYSNGYVQSVLAAADAATEPEVIDPPEEEPEPAPAPPAAPPAPAALAVSEPGRAEPTQPPPPPPSPKAANTRLPWDLKRAASPWPPPPGQR